MGARWTLAEPMQKQSAQKNLRFTISREETSPKIPAEKLFADLLKRQARSVMASVTECPSHTLPAHLARLDDLRDLFGMVMRHQFAETPESLPSGKQLMYAATLHDFAACLELTRKNHRAPAFVSSDDAWQERMEKKVDMLAGFLMRDKDAQEFFNSFERNGGGVA